MIFSSISLEAFRSGTGQGGTILLGHFTEDSLRLRICYSQASIYCEEDTLHVRVPLFLPPHPPSGGSPEHWQTVLSSCFGRFLAKRGLQLCYKLMGGGGCFSNEYRDSTACFGPEATEPLDRSSRFLMAMTSPLGDSIELQQLRIFNTEEVYEDSSRLINIQAVPEFVGRDSELKKGKELIATSKIVTIAGPTGSGKTALATTLALALSDAFDVVWKCTANTEPNLSGSLKQLGKRLHLGDQFSELLKYLNSHQVLLLLDNFDSGLSEMVAGLLEVNIRVIITSTKGGDTDIIRISGLDQDAAVEFVIGLTHRESERQEIESLCRELGCMPLALRTVCALLNFSPRERVKHLAQCIKDYPAGNEETDPRLMHLLEKCVKKVTSEAGKQLLMLTLDLSPDVIPEQLYKHLFSSEAAELDLAKKETEALFLLTEDKQHNLSVSPLVLQAIRNSVSDDLFSTKLQVLWHLFDCTNCTEYMVNLCKSVATLLDAVYARHSFGLMEMSLCIRYVYFCMKQLGTVNAVTEMCKKCCELWESSTEVIAETVSDFECLAMCCKDIAYMSQAEDYLSKVIAYRKIEGNKEKLATSYVNLGSVYCDQGKLEETERLYVDALAIREEVLRPAHPDLATSYGNFAVLYRKQGRLEESEAYLMKAQKIRCAGLIPPASQNTQTTLSPSRGRRDESEESLLKIVKLRETGLAPMHPDLAVAYFNLGVHYCNQGNIEASESYHTKALKIREAVLPPTHADLAYSYHHLADVYEVQGRLAEAEQLNTKALKIREATLPPMHEDLANSYTNFATLYQSQGRLINSSQFYLKALKIKEAVLPPTHTDLAGLYNNLGNVYYRLDLLEPAQQFHLKALRICEEVLSPQDPDLASSYNNLAAVYQANGNLQEAEMLFLKALKIREEVLSPIHPDLISLYNNLAIVYKAQGEFRKEKEFCKKAMSSRRRNR